MKKGILSALTCGVSLIVCVLAAGCGVYSPISGSPGNGTENGGNPSETGVYTATLKYGNDTFVPKTPMTATWTDGESVYTADFDDKGVAKVTGLDGDYKVTVSGLPEGYTYNPNVHMADGKDNRDIVIPLMKLKEYFGKGTGWYGGDVLSLTETGVYRLVFTQAGQEIKCKYATSQNGNYTIESIVDTSANEYNPRVDVHNGSIAYVNPEPAVTINDGGESSIYTKNFKYSVGTEGRGGACMFVVKCASRHNSYPAYVDLRIYRDGDYVSEYEAYSTVFPKEQLKQAPNNPGKRFVNFGDQTHFDSLCRCPRTCGCWSGGMCTYEPPGSAATEVCNCLSIFLKGSNVGYSDPLQGGDGYYHLLNAAGTLSDTLLYMKIKSGNRLVDFNDPRVSLNYNGKSYIYMIRGYSKIVMTDVWSSDIGYLGLVGGEAKIPEADKPYLEKLKNKSYADYANSDGAYPVTEELKQFLQTFSVKSAYFMDGQGYAESAGLQSTYKDQWLFGCGYYV